MSTQSVRLADVAQRAGTNTKTASRVLNGDPRVADDTRRRVQDAMNSSGTRWCPRPLPAHRCGRDHRRGGPHYR